jgi:glycosyltransferase involved in cell wall biosynthesis
VSVIVPARNEEASLGACLDSLVSQAGIAFEVILVDDGSTDGTRAIARSFPGVTIVEPGALPPGWSGKNNAVTAGAQRARGEWLLFTDADTVHRSGSLPRAVAEARANHADLLSYSPEQEVHGFWEKAIMPVIFAELAATYPPSEVSDPASSTAAANGQYLLITREAYDAVGGHAAVAGDLLEDVALARVVKQSGRKLVFRYAADAVRTRMYRNFRQLREGWTKNLAILFPSPMWLALWRFLEVVVLIASLALFIFSITTGYSRYSALFLFAPIVTLKRITRAHFAWSANVLVVFGLPLFTYLLMRSKLSHTTGTVNWKGRAYSPRDYSMRTVSQRSAGRS